MARSAKNVLVTSILMLVTFAVVVVSLLYAFLLDENNFQVPQIIKKNLLEIIEEIQNKNNYSVNVFQKKSVENRIFY